MACQGVELVRRSLPTAALFLTLSPRHALCNDRSVIGLGALGEAELGEAYRMADLLIMPSLVETVGLPMLEAMSMSVPVLAAKREYAIEICRDAAVLFDPLSTRDFAEKAMMALQDEELRSNLIETGHRRVETLRAAQPYRRMLEKVVGLARARR